jgi:pyruvate/2-oxoglutarate dehydrogenase complex dihydrolipoamide dehydrogenase (E3) component
MGAIRNHFDIIVIGAGSAGLSISLFMNKAGFKVLLVDKSDHNIGGDCLNDGCVPSKSLIHVAKIIHRTKESEKFGLNIGGEIDLQKVLEYVHERQNIIREHENAAYFEKQGLNIVLGEAKFTGKNEIDVNGSRYTANKIVIATGSRPQKLEVPGVDQVRYYDNTSIFDLKDLPQRLLIVGAGPIGIEIGQAFTRLGATVTILSKSKSILQNDDNAVTEILQQRLKEEGIKLITKAEIERFIFSNEAILKSVDGSRNTIEFDAVFVAIGRALNIESLNLESAGVEIKDGKIVTDHYLRTTNRNVFVCGDVAGNLKFSHAAEQQARILLNNFFSPFKKKLNNDYMSWVTFTDPEIATFGLSEKVIKQRGKKYRRIETDFSNDDRAVTDNNQQGKLILFISQGSFFHKEKILRGTMIAEGAGELVQELILAMTAKISINKIFNKVYPYPVASRVNQKLVVEYKEERLTSTIKKLLRWAFKMFG